VFPSRLNLKEAAMKRIAPLSILLAVSVLSLAAARPATHWPNALTVHEWGTFTSVAGRDGRAIRWMPLDGPSDLPCFVSREGVDRYKAGLWGTVRMETPVLYFYAPNDLTISANVQFRGGEITEWYPPAIVTRGNPPFAFAASGDPAATGSIEWRSVKVSPRTAEHFPVESAGSRYYSARQTDAAPLETQSQREKFLFYRGVGTFAPPITAIASDDGAVTVNVQSADEIGAVILFVNRGGHIGFRVQTAVRGATTLAPPSTDGDVESLGRELERLLVAQGLYEKEAAAMVDTWRDSWLEEGTRVLYVVPRHIVDAVLPLDVTPRPQQTVRVFVGRMEVITPAAEREVRDALTAADRAALARYGRFLQPISARILESMPLGSGKSRVDALLQSIAAARLSAPSPCAAP
jgi:hypothetical protein